MYLIFFFNVKATYVLKIIKGTMHKAAVSNFLQYAMKSRLCNARNGFTSDFKRV